MVSLLKSLFPLTHSFLLLGTYVNGNEDTESIGEKFKNRKSVNEQNVVQSFRRRNQVMGVVGSVWQPVGPTISKSTGTDSGRIK